MNCDSVTELRDSGYAVVIFSPDELRGAAPDQVEDRMIEVGWDIIDSLSHESTD